MSKVTDERLDELIPYIEDALISLSAKNAALAELKEKRENERYQSAQKAEGSNSPDHDPDYPAWDGKERRKVQMPWQNDRRQPPEERSGRERRVGTTLQAVRCVESRRVEFPLGRRRKSGTRADRAEGQQNRSASTEGQSLRTSEAKPQPSDLPERQEAVYLCRASGECSHNFRVAADEDGVIEFYDEMFGKDMDGSLDSAIDHFRDSDNWSNGGTAYDCALYCATFEVWKVNPSELKIPAPRQPEASAAEGTPKILGYFNRPESRSEGGSERIVGVRIAEDAFAHLHDAINWIESCIKAKHELAAALAENEKLGAENLAAGKRNAEMRKERDRARELLREALQHVDAWHESSGTAKVVLQQKIIAHLDDLNAALTKIHEAMNGG